MMSDYDPFQHSAKFRFHNIVFKKLPTFVAEPLGSVGPKVDDKDRLTLVNKRQGINLSLVCPAQSYPMPAYR